MIRLEHLTKSYPTPKGRHYLFRDLNLELPSGHSIALMGLNGAGKSTLLRIIGGIDYPDSGRVVTDCTISWPIGLASCFQGSLTARQNVRFVARLYVPEEQIEEKVRFVQEFAELGKYFDMPVKSYSSGMRGRLTFGLSMAFDFDYYLVDEAGAAGDAKFRQKSEAEYARLKQRANFIIVSHNKQELLKQCDMAVWLKDGQATVYHDIREAIEVYESYALAQKKSPA
jgi:capsular polysaccharide transport system ATP-binding protein